MYVSANCISTSIVNILLTFDLSLAPLNIFQPQKLFDSQPSVLHLCMSPEIISVAPFDSATSLQSIGSAYTCIQLEIPGP